MKFNQPAFRSPGGVGPRKELASVVLKHDQRRKQCIGSQFDKVICIANLKIALINGPNFQLRPSPRFASVGFGQRKPGECRQAWTKSLTTSSRLVVRSSTLPELPHFSSANIGQVPRRRNLPFGACIVPSPLAPTYHRWTTQGSETGFIITITTRVVSSTV